VANFTRLFDLGSTNAAIGPVATSGFLVVDFTANPNTGAQIVNRDVWGAGTSSIGFNNYSLLNDATFQTLMKTIPMSFYRQNARSGVGNFGDPNTMESAFAADGTFQNWNGVDPFINRWPLCFNNFGTNPPKFIMGVNADVTYFNSPAIFQSVCQQFAQHFKDTPSTATGVPLPMFGWEIGNESQDTVSAATYNSYFNAGADGFHAVDPNYKIFGPVYNAFGNIPSSFVTSCGSRCHALTYHNYKFSGNANPGTAAIIDMTSNPGVFRPSSEATNARTFLTNNGFANMSQAFGEWAMDDTPSSTIDPQQQDHNGAVFAAQWILDGIRVNKGVEYGAIWELVHDQQYGMIQGTGGPPGGIAPSGYLLSKATDWMWGTRVADSGVKTGPTGDRLNMLSVKDGFRFAVMIINFSTTQSYSGQVALSHWPLNDTGTATINRWEISSANPVGATTSINVTAGLTPTMTIPATSVVILTSP
jgi:hypothetical protein